MSHGTGSGSSGGAGSDPFRKVLIGALVAVVMIVAILAVKNSVPQPTGSIVALVLLIVGLAIGYKAIAGKSGAGGTAHAPAGGHGGHGSEGGVIALCVLLSVGGVAFLFAEFTQIKVLNEQGYQKRDGERMKMLPPPPMTERRYSVEVPTDGEISLPIPIGMTCDTDPVKPGQRVWVRYEGSIERFLDWKGRPNGGTKFRNGGNYKYLQSAETFPVEVEVHLHKTD